MMNDWRDVTLGEIFDISSSKRVHQADWKSTGVPFYRAREIVKLARDGRVQNELFISEELYAEYRSKYGVPQSGDLMISAVGTLGACYVVQPKDRFYYKDASVLRFHPNQQVCSKFIQHAFNTRKILDQVHAGSGSTVGTYTVTRAKETQILLPPMTEQRRIANILDQVEALRAKRRAALTELDTFTQSLFLDLFGDPEKNEKQWELHKLGDELTLQGGYAFKSSDYTSTGIRLVKISNVHKDNIEWSDTDHLPTSYLLKFSEFSLFPGDVVLALTRPIIKSLHAVKIAVVQNSDVPCLLNQRVGRFKFPSNSRLSAAYLLEYCRTKTFFRAVQSFCSESLQPNMSTSQVENIEIAVPPISLQRDFARRVTAVEKLKTAHRESLAELDALFASLQHRAFNGEL